MTPFLALALTTDQVGIALGHTDGGELVRRLYGHRDHDRALDRVAAAYERTTGLKQVQLGVDVGLPSQSVDKVPR